jgi:CubicO group peptidase (beta-lactamase class C family)
MRPRDLARVGQSLLNGGKVAGRSIVPVDWLEDSFKPQVTIRDRREYGYQWYLGEMVFNNADGPHRGGSPPLAMVAKDFIFFRGSIC